MYLLATVCEFIVESAVSFSVLVKNKSSLSLSAYRKHKKDYEVIIFHPNDFCSNAKIISRLSSNLQHEDFV